MAEQADHFDASKGLQGENDGDDGWAFESHSSPSSQVPADTTTEPVSVEAESRSDLTPAPAEEQSEPATAAAQPEADDPRTPATTKKPKPKSFQARLDEMTADRVRAEQERDAAR